MTKFGERVSNCSLTTFEKTLKRFKVSFDYSYKNKQSVCDDPSGMATGGKIGRNGHDVVEYLILTALVNISKKQNNSISINYETHHEEEHFNNVEFIISPHTSILYEREKSFILPKSKATSRIDICLSNRKKQPVLFEVITQGGPENAKDRIWRRCTPAINKICKNIFNTDKFYSVFLGSGFKKREDYTSRKRVVQREIVEEMAEDSNILCYFSSSKKEEDTLGEVLYTLCETFF